MSHIIPTAGSKDQASMPRLATFLAALFAVLALAAPPAGAQAPQPLSAPDLAAIHSVVQTERDGVKQEDYAGADAVAAPSWKVLYPTLDAFTRVVRTRYAQLIRPKSIV